MNILAIDIGGTHIKFLLSGQDTKRFFDSGPGMTPAAMVAGVKKQTADWKYDVVAMGYPGVVRRDHPSVEPFNLGKGWVDFDFEKAFGCPVRIINDAAMQALGLYEGGKMLFLGLGTGLGSAMIVDGEILPMELAHMPYRKATFEDYVGMRGLEKYGKHKWRELVAEVVACLAAALEPEDIVLGGGLATKLKTLPHGCRLGANSKAFVGGFRLWQREKKTQEATPTPDSNDPDQTA